MDAGHPLAVVTPTLDGDVLMRLARAQASFTPGQLQRLIPDASVDGVRKVLKRLARQGIVSATSVGNAAVMYSLNREHVAAGPIIDLATLPSRLRDRIADLVRTWSAQPPYAALFGSWARGTATVDSDVDIFLVRPTSAGQEWWDAQVAALEASVTRWTGNDARALSIDEEMFPAAADSALVERVRIEGLPLHGDRRFIDVPSARHRDCGQEVR